jgi:hypothetical protein
VPERISDAHEVPVAVAPSLTELIELSLVSWLKPSVFADLSLRPRPSVILLFAVIGGSSLVSSLIRQTLLLTTSSTTVAQTAILIGFITGLIIFTFMTLTLFFAMKILSSQAGFGRAWQATAMISVLWPILVFTPSRLEGALIAGLFIFWLSTNALIGLCGTHRWPTFMSGSILAVLIAGLNLFLIESTNVIFNPISATSPIVESVTQVVVPSNSQIDLMNQLKSLAPRQTSGLDLLKTPSEIALTAQSTDDGALALSQNAHALQAGAAGMLETVAPILDNPALIQNLNAEQLRQLGQVKKMMRMIKGQMNSGKSLSDAEFARRMKEFQTLTLKLMDAGTGLPADPTAVTPASEK